LERNFLVMYHWYERYTEEGNRPRLPYRKILYTYLIRLIITRKIPMPFLDFHITTRCTLNCRDCNHLTPYYSHNTHYTTTFEQFRKDLDKVLSAVDSVYHLQLVGGEPFLHKEIEKIFAYADRQKKIKTIRITTNGTIIPTAQMLALLQKSRKTIVAITDYSHLQLPYIKHEEVVNTLKMNGITCSENKPDYWFAQPDIYKSGRSAEELKREFDRCYLRNCSGSFCDGKIYACPVALAMHRIHNYQAEQKEIIDVRNAPNLRKELTDYYTRSYWDICDYCHIPQAKEKVPVAVQTNKILKIEKDG